MKEINKQTNLNREKIEVWVIFFTFTSPDAVFTLAFQTNRAKGHHPPCFPEDRQPSS